MPVTPGYDGAGVVDALGEGVTGLAVGDACLFMPQRGCFATHMLLPSRQVVTVDAAQLAKATPERSACVALTGVTAYQMLHRAAGKRLEHPDAAVLVHGATGGTGAMLVELAKLAGVKHIYGTCSARNMDAVRAAGATAIDYATDWAAEVPAAPDLGPRVRSGARRHRGWRLSQQGPSLHCQGRHLHRVRLHRFHPGTLTMSAILPAMVRISAQNAWSCVDGRAAVFYNVAADRDARPHEYAADARALLGFGGKLDPVVGKTWPFEQGKDALLAIEAGTHRGKQVVRVSGA